MNPKRDELTPENGYVFVFFPGYKAIFNEQIRNTKTRNYYTRSVDGTRLGYNNRFVQESTRKTVYRVQAVGRRIMKKTDGFPKV